jgi:uncharacterized membrane protein YecN with MAPEG domain
MIKAILLVLNPVRTWDNIVLENRNYLSVALAFLLPLLAITCAAEGYALVHWGKAHGPVKAIKKFSTAEAISYEAFQCVLSVALVFFGAKLLKRICETFHGRQSFQQAFRTVAYGLSPLFLMRLLDMLTHMSPWIPWCIGIALSIAVLYHGVPRVMQPDPPQAFGLYITTVIMLALASGAVRFITACALAGKLKDVHTLFLDAAKRLGF